MTNKQATNQQVSNKQTNKQATNKQERDKQASDKQMTQKHKTEQVNMTRKCQTHGRIKRGWGGAGDRTPEKSQKFKIS